MEKMLVFMKLFRIQVLFTFREGMTSIAQLSWQT